MPSERDLIQQIQSDVTCLVQAVADAQFWHDRWLEQARQEHERCVAGLTSGIGAITQSAGLPAAPWDEPLWGAWAPTPTQPSPNQGDGWGEGGGSITSFTRIGQLVEAGQWHRLTLPALLPLIGGRNVLLEASGAAKATAVRVVQSLMLRVLAAIPPGKLRFTFIDPVGLGQNVAAFMHLADYDENLVTGKAWTEPQHIEAQLADLTEHMELVIQKFLRDKYPTMEAYNVEAGEVAEPYRVLVVTNFPVNFTDAAARRLVSIVANGPRCGVYTLITVDTEQPLPYGFNLDDLERTSTVIAWDGEHFVWQDFEDCLLELDEPPPTALFDRILPAVGVAAKEGMRVEVPFERIAPPPEVWWTGDTRGGILALLGRAGATKVQLLDLGRGTAQHALVAGKTGAGKSTLLHTLIATLSLTYPPDEMELYLVDFKKGVEFKTYATHQLPHARVVAIESEREFGLSVLQRLDSELKRRGDLFRAAGVDHIADYRAKALPRILLLVDEFQEFFVEDDAIASQASQILDRLVRQGRAFGIHVLLGSQTLAGAYTLARSTIDQMAVRIALQCSEADSRLILADDNPAARLLSRPGEAIYNAANGLVEGNNLFQVAWLPDEKRDVYLQRLREMAKERGYVPPQPQIVFEGNAPADPTKNRLLRDLLTPPIWPLPARKVAAWLGEPIAIKDPTAAYFRRQSGSNLLIVGQNDEAAMGIMVTALISLAAQTPSLALPLEGEGQGGGEGARFYVLDFSPVDASYAGLFSRLSDLLPHPVRVTSRRGLPEVIAEIASEVERRMNADKTGASPMYLFIYGLQRARDLRQEEEFSFPVASEGPAPPSPAKQFATILQEGPDLGIHTLVWCDTYTNLTRATDRRSLREFEMRVVFQMGAEDSSNLIDTPAASKLGPFRALYFSEEEGRLEEFRPYGLPPEEEWLAWVGERLRGKGAPHSGH
ncbi:MAG: FtsK/SpoIIIE domain-containing protein [Chloroflexota bacterium]